MEPRTPERTTAFGTFAGQDHGGKILKPSSQVLNVYSALRTAKAKVPDWPESSIVPVLCTVGMQSSGKTTFVEALTRFPIGPTCLGTGTRCPVRYILSDGEPYFAVGKKELAERSHIQKEVESHMQKLAKQKTFSKDELVVKINDKGLASLDITDLPGLKVDGDGAKEIKDVVRTYVQQQSARPIVLVKATENVETQADVELLKSVGIEPGKGNALFFVNYLNHQIYRFTRVSELNNYFRGYLRAYGSVCFGMLIYSKDAKHKKDTLDFDGLCTFYQELPKYEKQTFLDDVNHMEQDEKLSEDATKFFGFRFAEKYMEDQIINFILREGTVLSEKIAPLEMQYSKKVQDLASQLAACTPENMKIQREKYVDTWWKVVRGIQQCRESTVSNLLYNPKDSSQTFFQEEDRMEKKSGSTGLRRMSFAKDQMLFAKDQKTDLEQKLSADASLVRLSDVFEAVVNNQIQTKDITRSEARSISGYAPGCMPGAFDHLLVVKEVATRPLADVTATLQPMLLHIKAIYEHPLQQANKVLESQAGRTESLSEMVTHAYQMRLESKLEEARQGLEKLVVEKKKYLPAIPEERHNVVDHGWLAKTKPICSIAFVASLHTVGIYAYTFLFPDKGIKVGPECPSKSAVDLTSLGDKFGLVLDTPNPILTVDKLIDIVNSTIWLSQEATQQEQQQPFGLTSVMTWQNLKALTPYIVIWVISAMVLFFFWAWTNRQSYNDEMKKLNNAAKTYCERCKGELLGQIRTKIAEDIFHYLEDGIMEDVRSIMRKHIRTAQAKQIDEETRLEAKGLREQQAELQSKVEYIRDALRAMDSLRDEHLTNLD